MDRRSGDQAVLCEWEARTGISFHHTEVRSLLSSMGREDVASGIRDIESRPGGVMWWANTVRWEPRVGCQQHIHGVQLSAARSFRKGDLLGFAPGCVISPSSAAEAFAAAQTPAHQLRICQRLYRFTAEPPAGSQKASKQTAVLSSEDGEAAHLGQVPDFRQLCPATNRIISSDPHGANTAYLPLSHNETGKVYIAVIALRDIAAGQAVTVDKGALTCSGPILDALQLLLDRPGSLQPITNPQQQQQPCGPANEPGPSVPLLQSQLAAAAATIQQLLSSSGCQVGGSFVQLCDQVRRCVNQAMEASKHLPAAAAAGAGTPIDVAAAHAGGGGAAPTDEAAAHAAAATAGGAIGDVASSECTAAMAHVAVDPQSSASAEGHAAAAAATSAAAENTSQDVEASTSRGTGAAPTAVAQPAVPAQASLATEATYTAEAGDATPRTATGDPIRRIIEPTSVMPTQPSKAAAPAAAASADRVGEAADPAAAAAPKPAAGPADTAEQDEHRGGTKRSRRLAAEVATAAIQQQLKPAPYQDLCSGHHPAKRSCRKDPQATVHELLQQLSSDNADGRCRAVVLLDLLSNTNSQARQKIAAAGVVPAVAALLDSSLEECQLAALRLLTWLTQMDRCTQELLAAAGSVQSVVDLLRSEDEELEGNATNLLCNLAEVPAGVSAVIAAGAVPQLAQQLSHNSRSSAQLNSGLLLAYLATKDPTAVPCNMLSTAVQVAVKCINHSSSRSTQLFALQTLACLATHSNLEGLLDAVTKVLSLLDSSGGSGAHSTSLQTYAAQFVLHMSQHDGNLEVLATSKILGVLIKAIQAADDDQEDTDVFLSNAVGAIYTMVKSKADSARRVQAAAVAAGIIPAATTLLQTIDAYVQSLALQILGLINEEYGLAVHTELRSRAAVPTVVSLVSNYDEDVQRNAAGLLAKLLQGNRTISKHAASAGAIVALEQFLVSRCPSDMKDAVKAAIQHMTGMEL